MQRRLAGFLVLIFVVGLLWWVFRRHLSLAALIEHEQRLRSWVVDYPVLAPLIGLFVYVLASLVPGTGGKAVVYGWLFGFWMGLVIVNVGLTAGAVIVFLVIRYCFQGWVHRRFPEGIQQVDAALCRDGPFYLVMLRLLHAPYTLTNYALGSTAVPLRTFWWSTHVGLLPGNVAFVLAGAQLPTLEELFRQGIWSFINVPLWIGLSLATLIPVAIRWAARHWSSPQSHE